MGESDRILGCKYRPLWHELNIIVRDSPGHYVLDIYNIDVPQSIIKSTKLTVQSRVYQSVCVYCVCVCNFHSIRIGSRVMDAQRINQHAPHCTSSTRDINVSDCFLLCAMFFILCAQIPDEALILWIAITSGNACGNVIGRLWTGKTENPWRHDDAHDVYAANRSWSMMVYADVVVDSEDDDGHNGHKSKINQTQQNIRHLTSVCTSMMYIWIGLVHQVDRVLLDNLISAMIWRVCWFWKVTASSG